jgi:hypothetical protein
MNSKHILKGLSKFSNKNKIERGCYNVESQIAPHTGDRGKPSGCTMCERKMEATSLVLLNEAFNSFRHWTSPVRPSIRPGVLS